MGDSNGLLAQRGMKHIEVVCGRVLMVALRRAWRVSMLVRIPSNKCRQCQHIDPRIETNRSNAETAQLD